MHELPQIKKRGPRMTRREKIKYYPPKDAKRIISTKPELPEKPTAILILTAKVHKGFFSFYF